MRVLFLLLATVASSAWAQSEVTLDELLTKPTCWVCSAKFGKYTIERAGDTQAHAKAASLSACQAISPQAKKECAPGSCWTSQYVTCDGKNPAPPHGHVPAPQPGHCSTTFDCSTGFQVCVHGQCVDKGGLANQCNSNLDCASPATCEAGHCAIPGLGTHPGCTTNLDCGGQQCIGGSCMPGAATCFSDSQCPMFQHCLGGTCMP